MDKNGKKIYDINIKLQEDSIHFIQYLKGNNKIFKYTEGDNRSKSNQYGSIESVKKLDL